MKKKLIIPSDKNLMRNVTPNTVNNYDASVRGWRKI